MVIGVTMYKNLFGSDMKFLADGRKKSASWMLNWVQLLTAKVIYRVNLDAVHP